MNVGQGGLWTGPRRTGRATDHSGTHSAALGGWEKTQKLFQDGGRCLQFPTGLFPLRQSSAEQTVSRECVEQRLEFYSNKSPQLANSILQVVRMQVLRGVSRFALANI